MTTQTIVTKVQPFLFLPNKKSNKSEVETARAVKTDLETRILAIKERLADKTAFLPIETGPEQLTELQRKLEKELAKAKSDLSQKEFQLLRHQRHIKMVRTGFPNQLDLSFLASTKKFPSGMFKLGFPQVWPAFGVVSVNNQAKTFRIEARAKRSYSGTDSVQASLPKQIGDQYFATGQKLLDISRKSDSELVSLSARTQGIMPDAIRDKIRDALDRKLFDQVFIIFEVFEWQINVTKQVPEDDPIVIGWCDDTEQAFVIDVYDPTKLEEYVVAQFGFTATLPENT